MIKNYCAEERVGVGGGGGGGGGAGGGGGGGGGDFVVLYNKSGPTFDTVSKKTGTDLS
jgi:hypothetical protein